MNFIMNIPYDIPSELKKYPYVRFVIQGDEGNSIMTLRWQFSFNSRGPWHDFDPYAPQAARQEGIGL